ncbi:MAG TPA: D-alanine--D-alanine ligase [Longimicrobiales bacterium]|nr:D-alanine--D-alanine ligase [Longimicrobiales bacterium]
MRVTVLLGGASDERDVSLATGAQVARALRAAGHEVTAFDTAQGPMTRDQEETLLGKGVDPRPASLALRDRLVEEGMSFLAEYPEAAAADVFFIALHGGDGEDGTLQKQLDRAGVVYTGSGPVACRAAMDKDLTKAVLQERGIPTPAWLTDCFDPDRVEAELGLPVIVKAANGGSSLRLELAHDRSELEGALERARDFQDSVVVERYVRGREFTVGILDQEALPVGEIIPRGEYFDYECKYQPGMAREVFPAELDPAKAGDMQALALEVHGALGLRDYSRIDFMMDEKGGLWCLEANTLPGLTANSLVPKAAAAAGIAFPELCHRLVDAAARRGAVGT